MATFQERIEFLSASSATILSKLSELRHLREQVKQAEEIAKEQELQKVYERIWIPPPVQHSPWD